MLLSEVRVVKPIPSIRSIFNPPPLPLRFLIMTSLEALYGHFESLGRVVLGYSGGVDSALLAVAATRLLGRDDFLAVTGRSASYPEVQWRTAMEIADRFGIPLLEVATEELMDRRYRSNSTDRCYFCKQELWRQLRDVASERGFDTVVDGTNADDLGQHRPGARAGAEAVVRSPLAELGWTKAMVREAARSMAIPIWDAPSSPCLSSRVRYGVEVTPERLRQVEDAETFLRSIGVGGDLRVRHLGDTASIEVDSVAMVLVDSLWPSVVETLLALGFSRVHLDPEGYRRGSLLSVSRGS